MYDNLIFILIVFFFIIIIFIFFPNQKSQKISVNQDDIIIKVEKNDSYAAIISKNNTDIKEDNINDNLKLSPSMENEKKYIISNLRILDFNQESKNTFIFNEKIYLYFDYELPEGFFTFKVKTIPELSINLKEDILRTKKGSNEKNPIVFSVNNTEKLEDILIEELNIQIFKTDDYEIPVYNYIYPANITIKNLKINLIREDDYTTPLILSNT